ncbi:FG-GAP-like repeat-containing protein [Baaleninema sp.]|uniref:FG-GAP-like repeat-containing protein n=1 Tax=Baaleninema sp. TaxID=3101197 RepID=UPI003D0761E7
MSVEFTRTDYPITGSSPQSVVVADFNNDSHLDIATANEQTDNISVLLGDGTGNFGSAVNFPVSTEPPPLVGYQPRAMVAGDFNNDTRQDLAIANHAGSLSILWGDGTGNFNSTTPLALNNFDIASRSSFVDPIFNPNSISAGQVNQDGNLDLIIAGDAIDYDDVLVLLGNGAGQFSATSVSANGYVEDAIATDINRDGNADLVTANSLPAFSSDTVSLFFGDGTGNFTPETDFPLGLDAGASAVVTEDFNRDGNPDVALANAATRPGSLSVLLGNGTDNLNPAKSFNADNPFTLGLSDVATGDFNGDGILDLAATAKDVSRNELEQGTDDTVSIFLGDGTGSFGAATAVDVANGPTSVAAGDFNHDGYTDLVTAQQWSDDVSVLIQSIPTGSEPPVSLEPTPNDDVLLGSETGEQIFSLAGNDAVAGFAGDDSINGGPGNDTLYGNTGNDVVVGGDMTPDGIDGTENTVWGGGVTTPEDGNDIVLGGRGNDIVADNRGDDLLNGNMGNDTVLGGEGRDTLFGGRDNDLLISDADVPLPNGGDDVLIGDLGRDTLVGGEGADLYVLRGDTDDLILYNDAEDVIALPSGIGFEDLDFVWGTLADGVTPTTQIIHRPTTQLLAVLPGVDPSQMSADDFLVS